MCSPSSPPIPLACQHQRPELIFCEAGPAPPPSGITCLTPACGSDTALTIKERQGSIDKISAVFRVNISAVVVHYDTECFVRSDFLSEHLKEVKLSRLPFFPL